MITYLKQGDYFIPDLTLKSKSPTSFGKYGQLRLNYLKQHNKVLYQQLLAKDELTKHLIDTDEVATARVDMIIKSLAEKEKVDENLKANNQLKWIGFMNNFKSQAEEIVFNELIYN
jgi:hypothetical protein